MKQALQFCFFVFFLCFIQIPAYSNPAELQNRGEICLFFSLDDVPSIQSWKGISIDKIRHDTVWAYVNQTGYNTLVNQDIPFETIPFSIFKSDEDFSHYPGYEAYVARMYEMADSFPHLCSVIKAGESVQGRDILFARITGASEQDKKQLPAFMFSSSMHGNELSGYIMMLNLIEYMLKNYDSNETVRMLLDSTDIWINPLANPDGTYFGGNHSVAEATRFNANNVDLNRNFPDPDGTLAPDGNPLQVENQVMITLFESHHFVLSANLHDGAEVLNYPWDTWQELHADDLWYIDICRRYADTARERSGGNYLSGFNNGITNGWAWYSINGSRQDYVNYYQHMREVTIELSNNKMPDSLTLDSLWQLNRSSMLQYITAIHGGIKGSVRDAETGKVIQAKIEIPGHDKLNSHVYSDPLSGKFFRPLLQDEYTLKISAPQYADTLLTIYMENKSHTLSIALQPEPFEYISFSFTLYPNPAHGSFTIAIENPEEDATLTIFDLQGRVLWQTKPTSVQNSAYQETISVLHNPGVYIVQYHSHLRKESKLLVIL